MDDLHRTTAHLDQRSARAWFASDRDELGTFVWACQIINVDPNFIRSQLDKKLRMKKSDELVAISMQSLEEKKLTAVGSGPRP